MLSGLHLYCLPHGTLDVHQVYRFNLPCSKELLQDPTLRLAVAMTKQSLTKQFLSEGDKLIVSRISDARDQGGYAVALNYGRFLPSMTQRMLRS